MRNVVRSPLLAAAMLCLVSTEDGQGQDKQDVRLVVQTGHTSEVRAIAFSPDGRRVLTGDQDATRLWDVETGKELLSLAIGAPVMAFSPDGKYIATTAGSGTGDGSIRLWDAHTGNPLHTLDARAVQVYSVAFSSDGKHLLSIAPRSQIIWDVQSGRPSTSLKAASKTIPKLTNAVLSPDEKQILAAGPRNAYVLDAKTGKELHTLQGHTTVVSSVAFSPDGKRALTGSMDHTAKLWDPAIGKDLITFRGHTEPLYGAVFSPDGKRVLTGSYDHTARIWDAANGRELHLLKGHTDRVTAVAFSPDGKRVLSLSQDRTARLWDAQTGKNLRILRDQGYARQTVAFSRDYTRILTCSNDATARLWDAQLGAEIHILKGHKGRVTAAAFAPDGKRVVTGGSDHSARLWDAETGKELHELKCPAGVIAVAFSADGKQVLTGSADHQARFWDAETGKPLSALKCPGDTIALAFSADGKTVLTGSKDHSARLFDAEAGKVVQTVKCPAEVHAVAISVDGKRLLTGCADHQARLWEAESGKLLHTVPGGSSVAFSPDGKQILTGGDDHLVRLFDAQTGKPGFTIRGHLKNQTAAMFSEDGKYIIVEDDLTRLWDARTGKAVCRFISFGGKGGWAVVDGTGRYDASNGGDVVGLHWVIHNEPVALNQLKDRYYEPGLLAKHLGFNKEPLRDVKSFRDVKLYPEVGLAQADAKKPQFKVDLKNSGGGIGRVVVLVNGKEMTGDARPPEAKVDVAELHVGVDLSKDPRVVPGRKNKVEILAYNGEGNLTSRGLVREFDGPGEMVEEPKSLHAVIIGVSQYSGEKLNLRYAAKDAEDMATALRLAAGRLFADKAHVTVLTTVGAGEKPTKANILKALEALRATKPADTVVVYLAGHGVAHGGPEGDWYYLTTDAKSADLTVAAVRQQVTVSSAELTDLLRAIPAQKQVLILDTCHSGLAAEKIAEHRYVPSAQVRAVERVKDCTGMHILAGCAADAVSYEATRYGQGILTYSLLMGMRGAKLRQGEFVDVVDLFGFAAEKVPELARDIGGVQRPTIASPRGDHFDIGRLTAEDQSKVPLQAVKPMLLRANFQDEQQMIDVLGLSKRVDDRLRVASSLPRGAKLIFVDAAEFAGALRVGGRYKDEGDKVTVTVKLFEGTKEIAAMSVEGAAGKPEELAVLVAAEIEKRVAASGGK